MAGNYRVVRRTDRYTLLECGDHYEVEHSSGERIVIEPIGKPGPPGPPGPPGTPGAAPTEEMVAQLIDEFELAHPQHYEWYGPSVATIDFDHPLDFVPNVEITDSAGSALLVPYTITDHHFHADLGGAVMSVYVRLS